MGCMPHSSGVGKPSRRSAILRRFGEVAEWSNVPDSTSADRREKDSVKAYFARQSYAGAKSGVGLIE